MLGMYKDAVAGMRQHLVAEVTPPWVWSNNVTLSKPGKAGLKRTPPPKAGGDEDFWMVGIGKRDPYRNPCKPARAPPPRAASGGYLEFGQGKGRSTKEGAGGSGWGFEAGGVKEGSVRRKGAVGQGDLAGARRLLQGETGPGAEADVQEGVHKQAAAGAEQAGAAGQEVTQAQQQEAVRQAAAAQSRGNTGRDAGLLSSSGSSHSSSSRGEAEGGPTGAPAASASHRQLLDVDPVDDDGWVDRFVDAEDLYSEEPVGPHGAAQGQGQGAEAGAAAAGAAAGAGSGSQGSDGAGSGEGGRRQGWGGNGNGGRKRKGGGRGRPTKKNPVDLSLTLQHFTCFVPGMLVLGECAPTWWLVSTPGGPV